MGYITRTAFVLSIGFNM